MHYREALLSLIWIAISATSQAAEIGTVYRSTK
jgi:hypothetical protein